MTEQEAIEKITKWQRYSVFGSPDEPDYGPDTPREYGLSSAEKTFDDPNRDLWRPLQDRINEAERRKDTKEAYDTVEPVYKSLDFGTRMQVKAFYFERNDWSGPPSHRMREAVNIFRGKVAHEGR